MTSKPNKKLVMANWRQTFESDTQASVDFYRVCPAELTVNPNYALTAFHHGQGGPTLFREVRRAPWRNRIQFEVQGLIDAPAGGKVESEEAFAHRILNALAFVVYNTWNTTKYHIVMHSSGYDSRLLSLVIKKLHTRFGDDWLGKIHFVCHEWEWPVFEQVMQYEGWPEDTYTSYRKEADPHEDWNAAITLDAWRGINGPRGLPFCPIYTSVTDLLRGGAFG